MMSMSHHHVVPILSLFDGFLEHAAASNTHMECMIVSGGVVVVGSLVEVIVMMMMEWMTIMMTRMNVIFVSFDNEASLICVDCRLDVGDLDDLDDLDFRNHQSDISAEWVVHLPV